MRVLRLAQVAATAEGLRLRRLAALRARRTALAMLALPFLIGCLWFLEAALWLALSARLPGWQAALAAAGANLVLAVLLAWPALRRAPVDPVARDAERLRREAVAGIRAELRLSAAVAELVSALASWLRRQTARDETPERH
ncbi:MAG: hypothetical protein KGI51_07070 [Rhodospirillales bacterium]|nr:hypothetical protein [Rhodospirillales bacterium]